MYESKNNILGIMRFVVKYWVLAPDSEKGCGKSDLQAWSMTLTPYRFDILS